MFMARDKIVKVRQELATLGTLVVENQALKGRIVQLEQECRDARVAANEAEKRLKATTVDASKITDLEQKLMDAEKKLLDVEKAHAAELKKARDEGFAQLVQLVKAQQGQ